MTNIGNGLICCNEGGYKKTYYNPSAMREFSDSLGCYDASYTDIIYVDGTSDSIKCKADKFAKAYIEATETGKIINIEV